MTNIRKHPEYFNLNFRFPNEQFKDIKDFEGRFKISNYGRLLSINGRKKGVHVCNTGIGKIEGYYMTQLRKTPLNRRVRIHTLVAETFLIKNIGDECVNHLDGNKLNNHVSNLEWTTLALNCKHASENGLIAYGGDHHNAILNESSVRIIKGFLSKHTNIEIGKMFGVHRRTISDIRLNRTWLRVS